MNYNLKRHKLLGILSNGRDNFNIIKDRRNILGVSFEEMYKKLKCNEAELHSITSELYTSKEIEYYDAYNVIGLFSTPEGLTAYENRKYINVFWNNFFNTSKNIVQVFIPVFSLIIAYVALTTKSDNLKKEVDKELQVLKKTILIQEKKINKLETKVKNQQINNNTIENGK